MDKQKRKRKLIQLYSALLYNAQLKGFITGKLYTGPLKGLCVPGLNCYSCPGAVAACPLGSVQNALAASSRGELAYVGGILLLCGILLGRTICGWLCPFGLIQELLYRIPGKKIHKGRGTRLLSKLKYLILALLAVGIPLAAAIPAFCKFLCPAGTLEGAVLGLAGGNRGEIAGMLGGLFWWKLALLMVILTTSVLCFRAFCRFLCPLGALYGLFSRLNLIGVKTDQNRCIHCGACVSVCKTDVRRPGDAECIHCGECISVCGEKAITFSAGKWVLRDNETISGAPPYHKSEKTISCSARKWMAAAAAVILAGVLVLANLPGGKQSTEVGAEVGQRPAGFTVPMYDGSTYSLQDSRGQVTVISFWATYCAPCLEEMPVFSRLLETYGENVNVVLLHARLTTEDVPSFLKQLPDLPFGWDERGEAQEALNGSALLPETFVLDRDGIVAARLTGALHWDELNAAVEPLIGKGETP